MKRFRFNKIKWDKILSATLVIVLLVGCVAGLATIFNTKTTDVSDFNFKKGALDSAGFYVESDTSIYTKDLIKCQGLVIEPDFEATGEYQVFYYDNNKAFIGSTVVFDAHTDGVYSKGNDFATAQYCRIVISPDTPVDEDGYPVDDWKIHFWEVAGYADDYKITVDKKQKDIKDVVYTPVSLTVEHTGKYYGANTSTFIEQDNVSVSALINVEDYKYVKIRVPYNEASVTIVPQFFSANGNNINVERLYANPNEFVDGYYEFIVSVPSNATNFALVMVTGYEAGYSIQLGK